MKLFITLLLFSAFSQTTFADNDWAHSRIDYQGPLSIKVFHNLRCNCCHRWMNYLKQHQFIVTSVPTSNLAAVNDKLQLPKPMKSSHTALIKGYIIEGHVPVDDIKRLLIEKPAILGLAVPHMPNGAPGAERGPLKQNFIVYQFTRQGQYRAFTRYVVGKDHRYHAQPVTQ